MKRDLHKEVRVVYRACRRKYGVERTQDECLRVFKLVFPERHRADKGEDTEYSLGAKCRRGVLAVFASWKAEGKLRELLDRVAGEMESPMGRERFVAFCDDIMPVAMRIRKLTPRETGRLMDLDDESIDKMFDAGLSNSALYKLHGNSICVGVLEKIFYKLFINTGIEIKKGVPQQLSLF